MFVYAEVKQGHAFFVWLKQLCFLVQVKANGSDQAGTGFYQAVLFNLNKPFASDVAGKRIGHKQKEAAWL
ncbi:MAG: hypothetical protein J0L54_13610 [Chitinophagales bacterium]|nr:hypothetical protein [Chitinophagales bacterium]